MPIALLWRIWQEGLALTGTIDRLQKFRRAEFDYAKDDLLYFVKHYCFFEDKDSPEVIVPFCPWKAQEDAFLSIRDNRLNLFLKARQIGITWVALMYCAHDLIFHPGHTVIALSKTKNDADELVRRLGMILENMPSLLLGGEVGFEVKKSEVRCSSKALQSFLPTKPPPRWLRRRRRPSKTRGYLPQEERPPQAPQDRGLLQNGLF